MQIQNLKSRTKRSRPERVGRGGKRGKTSGRGTKGQKARAGHKIRPEIRDLIKKLPKRRGYRFASVAVQAKEVNLSALEKTFATSTVITPALLIEKGLIRGSGTDRPRVKILGNGSITKAFTISGCSVSAPAKVKIEAAGGSCQ